MDLISNLPREIKHNILYFLPLEDVARTSILSKEWNLTWVLRPILEFEEHLISRKTNFTEFLEKSLENIVAQGVSVDAFRLTITNSHQGMDDVISRWISFVLSRNPRELNISIFRSDAYDINMISSKTLTSLTLYGFELKFNNDDWGFPQLQNLRMQSMILDDRVVAKLVSGSHSLEHLSLRYSYRLTALKISSLVRLKSVALSQNDDLRRVEIRAPLLESFHFGGKNWNFKCDINLEACEEALKKLSIRSVVVTSEWVQSQISKFRGLEVLSLISILSLTSFKISSTKLTELTLGHCENLDEGTEIFAPNLHDLTLITNKLPFYSLDASSLRKVYLSTYLREAVQNKTVWFCKLRELFKTSNHMKDLVVGILCRRPKIAIVHAGLSDSLFNTIYGLDNSSLNVEIIIFSSNNDDRIWELRLMRRETMDIYLISSASDEINLPECLFSKLPKPPGTTYPCNSYFYQEGSRCFANFAIESMNDWTEFRGNDTTKVALLEAYNGFSFNHITKFSLYWLSNW